MRARNRGMALLATLAILAVLMILAASFAVGVRTETHLMATSIRRTQASWLAEAGLQRAFVELRDHPERFTALSDQATPGKPLVLTLDSTDEQDLNLQGGKFVVAAYDENARLNLNTAGEDVLRSLLPNEPQLVDAILDWRDTDTDTRDQGAESDFYEGLGQPYDSRNGAFQTVAELLLLKDVDPARFYGQDGLSPLADKDEVGSADPSVTPLTDLFTVSSQSDNADTDGNARVNVQTADAQTLSDKLGDVLTQQDVDAIVKYRDGDTAQEGQGGGQGQGGGTPAPAAPGGTGGIELPPVTPLPGATGTETPAAGGAAANNSSQTKKPATVAELIGVLGRDKLEQVYDRLTVTDDVVSLGLVNLNTADAEVLASLPGMDSSLAESIVNARQSQPFETVGDLLRLSEITDDVFEQVAPLLTTRSTAFRLAAQGTVGDGDQAFTRTIEAVVTVEPRAATDAQQERPAPDATATEAAPAARQLRLIYRRME